MNKLICFPNPNMRRVFMLSSDWESFDTIHWTGIAPDGAKYSLVIVDSMESVDNLFDRIRDFDEVDLGRINQDLGAQIRFYHTKRT